MPFWSKLKDFKEKISLITGIVILLTGIGIFPLTKSIINTVKTTSYIIKDYPSLKSDYDSLTIRIKIIEKKLEDYSLIKQSVIYLMEDNDVISGLLRANMQKIDKKNYGTVVLIYDYTNKIYTKRLVEVKIRKSNSYGDLYVFVPWGETLWGTPITKKFAVKWHEDEGKYFFIDKNGDFYLIYEIDINKTIRY
jgi:hypothetical protein